MGYVHSLNGQRRHAVLDGMEPLLIITGAGSGKTNTLAQRVAHLRWNFSRRGASELTRRVSRITEGVMNILLARKPDGQGLTVIGDDAPSTYAIRAADVRHILDFPTVFTPPAQVVTLGRDYQSTQPIPTAANAPISRATARVTTELRSGGSSV